MKCTPWYTEAMIEDWLFEHLDIFLTAITEKARQAKVWDENRERMGDWYGSRSVVDIVAQSRGITYLIEIKRDYISADCIRNQMGKVNRRRAVASQMVVAAPRISEKADVMRQDVSIDFWQIGVGGMPVG